MTRNAYRVSLRRRKRRQSDAPRHIEAAGPCRTCAATALIVDDGLATGYTMRAAIAAAKHQHASNIVVAVPHGALDSIEALKKKRTK
ncbi:MAG: hypothetical protein HND39_00005 [Ignavibacteriota bacterium]|nr:MAG: hypothetical protein HND39_00005 [Ignavibacteriota bacterium]